MHALLVLSELGSMLWQVVARKFETNPRASLAVATVGGLVLLVALLSLVSSLLWPAQRNVWGSVSGEVTSVSGAPVANAAVLFVNDQAGVGASATTDSSGHFTAYGVQPGRYVVTIQPVIERSGGELTKEAALAARSKLEASVPLRFQDGATSGLEADLKRGRNRYDIDLRERR